MLVITLISRSCVHLGKRYNKKVVTIVAKMFAAYIIVMFSFKAFMNETFEYSMIKLLTLMSTLVRLGMKLL